MIADDHMLFIDGLRLLLQAEEYMLIIYIANDGKELLDIIRQEQPDVVLLDINMPRINGIEAARLIKQSYYAIKIIIVVRLKY